MIRRPIVVTALAVATTLALSGCVPDELLGEPTRTQTTEPTADPPPATTRSPRPTPTPSTTASGDGTVTGSATHTPSATAQPTTTYTPPIFCPHIIALDPKFTVTPAGTDETTGKNRVNVVVNYTNPLDHPLWLRGSIGYLDSEGVEDDLYSLLPGGIAFEDVELPPGAGTLSGSFEDVAGQALESELYFTSWTISGLVLDTPGQAPCETNRGLTERDKLAGDLDV